MMKTNQRRTISKALLNSMHIHINKSLLLTALVTIVTCFSFTVTQAQTVLWQPKPGNKALSGSAALRKVKKDFMRFDTGESKKCNGRPSKKPHTSIVKQGRNHVWRIVKPRNNQRAEFARMKKNGREVLPKNNKTYWLGWRWKIGSSPKITDGIAVWQWKSTSDGSRQKYKQNYPFGMGYSNGKLSLSAYGPQPSGKSYSQSSRKVTLWEGNVRQNQWVHIVMRIKTSSRNHGGSMELWINGKKQTLRNKKSNRYKVKTFSGDNKRIGHRTYDGGGVKPKWGIYNFASCKFNNVATYYEKFLFAEQKRGDTNKEMLRKFGI